MCKLLCLVDFDSFDVTILENFDFLSQIHCLIDENENIYETELVSALNMIKEVCLHSFSLRKQLNEEKLIEKIEINTKSFQIKSEIVGIAANLIRCDSLDISSVNDDFVSSVFSLIDINNFESCLDSLFVVLFLANNNFDVSEAVDDIFDLKDSENEEISSISTKILEIIERIEE